MPYQYSADPFVCLCVNKDTGEVVALTGHWDTFDLANLKYPGRNTGLEIALPADDATWAKVKSAIKAAIAADSGVPLL